MTDAKVYIHEFIDIAGLNRAKYVHHMTANWSPTAQEDRNQLCYGVWPVVGSTGHWPQVVNMWELDGWDGLAAGFGLETGGKGAYDPKLERWWAHAAEFRRGGVDRIVVPAPWTRSIEELCADGVTGECYAHDLVTVRAGAAAELLERVRQGGVPLAATHEWVLAGAFRTAMANDDECILVWAVPTWSAWSDHEREHDDADSEVTRWRRSLDDIVTGWRRNLMVDAPLCPFRTGRQPRREDRTDWTD